ncbi:MAG: hypothetical protein ACKVRP_02735 [Bacteroidota bacterium]
MNTRLVMTISAALLLAHGLVLLFAPELLYTLFDLSHSPDGLVGAQLLSAALIGFGLMNWTARGLVLGGIFGRAVVYGNFVYSLIGFFVSLRAGLGGFGNQYFWIEVILSLASAIVFSFLLFRGPISRREP